MRVAIAIVAKKSLFFFCIFHQILWKINALFNDQLTKQVNKPGGKQSTKPNQITSLSLSIMEKNHLFYTHSYHVNRLYSKTSRTKKRKLLFLYNSASFIQPIIHFLRSLIYPFIHSFIYSFSHSRIRPSFQLFHFYSAKSKFVPNDKRNMSTALFSLLLNNCICTLLRM